MDQDLESDCSFATVLQAGHLNTTLYPQRLTQTRLLPRSHARRKLKSVSVALLAGFVANAPVVDVLRTARASSAHVYCGGVQRGY